MQPVIDHPWALSSEAAIQLQQTLAAKVSQEDRLGTVRLVAGADVAYTKNSDILTAAVVLIDASTLAVVETAMARDVARFPYVPGLFSFRELPPVIQALGKLQNTPDLVICDGQGIAHPHRFGLASHLGVIFDVPTIGCAKTLLLGQHAPLGQARGERAPLLEGEAVIGAALRTQDGVNPLYISSGHRISLDSACNWILKLTPHYRLPEPIRLADQAGRRV